MWWNPLSWFYKDRILDASLAKDDRSRAYPVRSVLPPGAVPVSAEWKCPLRLNQGREGMCVAFAIAHEICSQPVPQEITNEDVRQIYEDAQLIDEWPGEDYSGTSLVAGMKVATTLGYYDEYRWAFGIDDLVLAVGHLGPAVIAVNWYEGMQHTNMLVEIRATGKLTGKHAICCIGYDVKTERFKLRNSWGRSWGYMGSCWISKSDMARLLDEGGMAAIPVLRGRGAHEKRN